MGTNFVVGVTTASMFVAEERNTYWWTLEGKVNLALTGLTLRKHIVKCAIPHRGRSEAKSAVYDCLVQYDDTSMETSLTA